MANTGTDRDKENRTSPAQSKKGEKKANWLM